MAAIDKIYVTDEVSQHIFVGSWQASTDYDSLAEDNIKVIFSLEINAKPKYITDIYDEYKILSYEIHVDNVQGEDLQIWFPRIYAILDYYTRHDTNVLVHCGDGYSRAIVAVAAFLLMKAYVNSPDHKVNIKKQITDDVLKHVISKRKHASPSLNFVSQLRVFENMIRSGEFDIYQLKQQPKK